MIRTVLFVCLLVRAGAVTGELQITSGTLGSIREWDLNFLIKNVTTNVDTLPVKNNEPNPVTFTVVSQEPTYPENAFIFWRDTGELRNKVTFDYERHDEYTVVITAEPVYGTTATQTLTVNILNVNEFQIWSYPGPVTYYSVAITDGDTNDTDVLTVNCRDQDIGQTLAYTLEDPRDIFAVNSAGVIGLATDVTVNRDDFESVNYKYRVYIIATDDGYPPTSTTGTMSVTVNAKPTPTAPTDSCNTVIASVILTLMSLLIALNLL